MFSGTALLTGRFISSSVTKTNRSPILPLILIANLTRLEVFEIGEYHWIFPSFSRGIFGHVRRLDQLRASENIRWIIKQPLHTYPVLWTFQESQPVEAIRIVE